LGAPYRAAKEKEEHCPQGGKRLYFLRGEASSTYTSSISGEGKGGLSLLLLEKEVEWWLYRKKNEHPTIGKAPRVLLEGGKKKREPHAFLKSGSGEKGPPYSRKSSMLPTEEGEKIGRGACPPLRGTVS